ncbi:MAG: DUF1851 domain-containing protein [Hymenobacter sp.]|nr:MAG: DUF1851 domain-containing protein [Hymenobacter sp.]
MFTDFLAHFPTYNLVAQPTPELLARYQGLVPTELLTIWTQYGFGTFCEGYLKIVNPADYADLLADTYQLTSTPSSSPPLVLFATAMGDLLIWERGYIVLIDYRHGQTKVVGKYIELFFRNLIDSEYKADKLIYEPYLTARARLGEPAFEECFGYVPLLALGGPELESHLEKVKLREHLALIGQVSGLLER